MSDTINAVWQGGVHFLSKHSSGDLNMDGIPEIGGLDKGLRPKALMLSSLAGCTGIDLGILFKKMRIEVEGITIEVSAKLTEEHPRIYKSTHIIYTFTGANLDEQKIKRAVSLSADTYCGVLAMFRSFSEVTYDICFAHVATDAYTR